MPSLKLSANDAWKKAVKNCLLGKEVSPRNQLTLEVLYAQNLIDMKYPVVTLSCRKLSYRFMAAEAYWILSGSSRVADILPYCSNLSKYTDDGVVFSGAYGPPIMEQLRYILETLTGDPFSRQAVLTIWRQNPRASRDIPCTISLQFLLRNNKLNCVASMRSSDVWLGLPYDIFTFSMVSFYLALRLNLRPMLGDLVIHAGSQHLYEANVPLARDILNQPGVIADLSPMQTHKITHPDHLLEILDIIRDAKDLDVPEPFNQLRIHVRKNKHS